MNTELPSAYGHYNPKTDRVAGQPRPFPRYKQHNRKTGDEVLEQVDAVYPHEVLNIRRKADLETALEMYSHPFPMMDGSPVIHTRSGVRYLVEWLYPALRWYCRVYGVKIPSWLEEGKGWYDRLSPGDQIKAFGKIPVAPTEWVEDPRSSGARA